jgi:tRNA pseudouridine38-40 synthase
LPTFKITVAYDGTAFVGWQRQASGTSIQGLLEDALRDLDRRDVTVIGAGRTDAGVHALGQVASFSLVRSIENEALVGALNARLPNTVRIVAAEAAPDSFHARFGATRKIYRYRMWNADVLSPFERQYCWHVSAPLDRSAMADAATLIEGRHDFSAFQAAGSSIRSTAREIFSSRIVAGLKPRTTSEDDGFIAALPPRVTSEAVCGAGLQACDPALIVYEVCGDGFLRHMVRTIVGSLVDIGRRRHPVAWIREVLIGRDRARAGPTAPACGLVLVAVEYGGRLLAADRTDPLQSATHSKDA